MNMKRKGLIFVIFGGTGHLTYSKLMPAFYQLYKEGALPEDMSIVSIGRREKDTTIYREEIRKEISKKIKGNEQGVIKGFESHVHYFKMDFASSEDYDRLKRFFDEKDAVKGQQDIIYYLATAPGDFPIILENLNAYGLVNREGQSARAVFEKPFGYDLQSATEINERITKVLGEENIYRIDHYLGKEMIQSINMVRLTNQIFKSVWDKDAIDNIQITVKEKGGVEDRGGYYDQSGALRDMVQNHLLQILALIAMEPPKVFDDTHIRDEKVKVLRSIRFNEESVILGQYEGYRLENKVDPESQTETFVALKCEIDQPRWSGVPFYLRTGKYLDGKEAEVIIQFKNDTCCSDLIGEAQPNLLVIKIQPEEGIYFRINTKTPGADYKVMPVSMDYCQSCHIAYRSPEAYERLLLDIIKGDSTLFTRWDEVESAWRIVKKIVDLKKNSQKRLESYKPGGSGPESVMKILEDDGRKWWSLSDLEHSFFANGQ